MRAEAGGNGAIVAAAPGVAPRRAAVLTGLAGLALLLHALLWQALQRGSASPSPPPSARAAAMAVRSVPAAPQVLPAGPIAAAAPVPAPVPAPDAAPAPPVPTTAAGRPPGPRASTPVRPAAAPAPPPAAADLPPATRLPPPARLTYHVQRGERSGHATLHWQPEGDRYRAGFEASIDERPWLQQTSEGDLDAGGIAPLRFTEQRGKRAAAAANFRRDRGTVSFSGPAAEPPLEAGAQDRLSGLLQLAAIGAATPGRMAAGAQLEMPVVSAQGDSGAWVWQSEGSSPEGWVHLRRLPRGPYEPGTEVWLDPQRHHLPVRLRIQPADGSAATELRLDQAEIGR